MSFRSAVAAITALASLGAGAAQAADYYQGKTLRIVVGFSPGGGNDLFARIFPARLGAFIPGNPRVIVENQPGAGGVAALNWFAKVAPRDGTVTYVASGNLVNRMVLNTQGTTAKLADLSPLISGPEGRIHYVNSNTGITKPKDILALKQPLFLGVTDPLATVGSVVGFTMLKIPFKAVNGYPGKNDALLALERGETTIGDMVTPVFMDSVVPLVQRGKVTPLYAQGFLKDGKLVRDPVMPELPTFAEYYRALYDKDPSGPEWEAFKAIVLANGNGGKILFMHPDIPAEARDALKKGVADVQQDPEFQRIAKTALQGYELLSGKELESNLKDMAAMPDAARKYMQDLFSRDYDMKFN